MHQCLQIREILSNIFENVNRGKDPTRCATLAGLARTCQVFHDPALDILWDKISDLAHLIKCMPSDSWIEEESPGGATITFTRSLAPPDWIRFQAYAARIKILVAGTGHSYFVANRVRRASSVDIKAFRALSIFRPLCVLFPSLKELEWRYASAEMFPYIHLFLAPGLLKFSLPKWPDRGMEQTTFLKSLAVISPLVDTFLLPFNQPDVVAPSAMAIIPDFAQLHTLTLGFDSLTPRHFVPLSRIARLRILHLQIYGDVGPIRTQDLEREAQTLPEITSPPQRFASLRVLGMNEAPLSTCTEIIRWMSPANLEELYLCPRNAPSPPSLESHLQVISQCVSWTSLRDFDLSVLVGSTFILPQDSVIIQPIILKPLLSFKNIRRFVFDCGTPLTLDNAILDDIAAAWPKLEELDLGETTGEDEFVSKVTLEGLVPFATRCPDLRTLRLLLDADDALVGRQKPGSGVSNHSLRSLELGRSCISESGAGAVAAFLSDLFPKLKTIVAWRDEDLDESFSVREWANVENLHSVFVRVREQERLHWARSGTSSPS
ncbi:hypothetical protein JAAARDRAFT_203263 [Jaapia argillacea MUCL 33604]|uniref:F-box domain-containing protein n=1 Tax=Jaapia argillacea MUCL 33604 TaxID=933084 RepID=A0A067QEW5_9AGAM|nr:hypothetical protein JAAARDRAFT_203263 [Jaapia argillacea MUCL 33604]